MRAVPSSATCSRSSRRRTRWGRSCTTTPTRGRSPREASVRSPRRSPTCPHSPSRVWCSPTSCSTTCRSAWSSVRPTDGPRSGSEFRVTGSRRISCRAAPELAIEADQVAVERSAGGSRIPVPTGVREWLHSCAFVLRRGMLIVVDYAANAMDLVERGQQGWLRTFRHHERGVSPLVAPGEQDITADLPLEYLIHAAARAGLALDASAVKRSGCVTSASKHWSRRPGPVGRTRPHRRSRRVAAPQPGNRGGRARRPSGTRCPPGARLQILMPVRPHVRSGARITGPSARPPVRDAHPRVA